MTTARARPRGTGRVLAGAVVLAVTGLLAGCSGAPGEQPAGSPSGIGAWPTFLPSPLATPTIRPMSSPSSSSTWRAIVTWPLPPSTSTMSGITPSPPATFS